MTQKDLLIERNEAYESLKAKRDEAESRWIHSDKVHGNWSQSSFVPEGYNTQGEQR